MKPKEYAESLRLLADWFEQQPDDVPTPFPLISYYVWGFEVPFERQKDLALRIARSFGEADKDYVGDTFSISKNFGGIKLNYLFHRDVVCTARVVGTKQVEETLYVKTGRMIEENIVEWDCHPLLAKKEGEHEQGS